MSEYTNPKCVERPNEECPMGPAGKWCYNCGWSKLGIDRSIADYKEYAKKHPHNRSIIEWMETEK